MTPEEKEFQTGCNALHLEVAASIAEDVRSLGKRAITAAVQAQREKDAGLVRGYLGETADNTTARTMQRVMDDIAAAIEKESGQ